MTDPDRPLFERIAATRPDMTPKNQSLADYILNHPKEAVFLRTRGLAEACGVSEATVVRFVNQLGYEGYAEFIQALRDMIDTGLSLMDRVELTNLNGPDAERTGRVIYQEINNLNHLYKHMDMDGFNRAADLLVRAPRVMTVGSRLSYSFSYLLGWMLTRVRPGVDLLKGSDTTALDRINEAPPETLVVVVATSRYSNELIRAARHTRRLGLNLLIVSDSPLCPLNQFGHVSLIAPCRHIPVIGSPSTLACLINCLLMEVIARGGSMVGEHQARLERHYRENDLLFNLEAPPLASEESVRPDNGEGYGT